MEKGLVQKSHAATSQQDINPLKQFPGLSSTGYLPWSLKHYHQHLSSQQTGLSDVLPIW